MAALMFFLKGLVVWVLAGAIARLFAGAGIAIVTYTLLDDVVQGFVDQVALFLSGLPTAVLSIMTIGGVGEALSIVGSALLSVAAIKAASMFLGVKFL